VREKDCSVRGVGGWESQTSFAAVEANRAKLWSDGPKRNKRTRRLKEGAVLTGQRGEIVRVGRVGKSAGRGTASDKVI